MHQPKQGIITTLANHYPPTLVLIDRSHIK